MCDHPENLRACKGAPTIPDGDMERCQAFGDYELNAFHVTKMTV